MAFWLYLSYMSFGHMQLGGDIARHIAEIWTKFAGLAGANSYFLKELEPKSVFWREIAGGDRASSKKQSRIKMAKTIVLS